MTRTFLRLASTCAGILLLSVASRATIVVDASGAGEFTSLEAAINAAADGEQLLVKSGSYVTGSGTAIVISGKGLSIVAEAGAVVIVPALRIEQMPAGHWVMLRGLTIDSSLLGPFIGLPALQVIGPEATVWAEDCLLKGTDGSADGVWPFPTFPGNGARVEAGADLTLQRCTVVGGQGWNSTSGITKFPPGNGASAVIAVDGRVSLHECTLTGGDVGPGSVGPTSPPPFIPPYAGAGLEVAFTGFAHVAGSTLTGGATGDNINIDDDESGDGLLLYGPAPSAWVRDSTLQPGAVINIGISGQPIDAPAGTVTHFAAPARAMQVSSPLREGQAGTIAVQGQQGDQVIVLVALGVGYSKSPGKQGILELDTNLLLLPIAMGGISDPGGSFTVPFVTPNLNPVLLGLTVPLQLAVVNGGVATLEAGSALAWLDSSL